MSIKEEKPSYWIEELHPKRFIKWARRMGFTYYFSGEPINPTDKADFVHFYLCDGKVAYIPTHMWCAKNNKKVKRYTLKEIKKIFQNKDK